jgi:hypothetical protein
MRTFVVSLICYSTARSLVKRLGDKMEVKIRPHALKTPFSHLYEPERDSP